MSKSKSIVCGIILGAHPSLEMAGLIAAQLDRDGARPYIIYYRESDFRCKLNKQMAEAIATSMNGHATMIPTGELLAEVQFCLDGFMAHQGHFAIIGTFIDGVMPHLREIGPKKGTEVDSAFNVLVGVVDHTETQVVTLKLPTPQSEGCPIATCSIVRPADDLVTAAVVTGVQKVS